MIKTLIHGTVKALAILAIVPQPVAQAQGFNINDPKQALALLIGAFQNCGPSQNFFIMGQLLYQTVYVQTGGTGCYPQLRNLGPVLNMQKLNKTPYPAGPIYTIRTDHQFGTLFWQIAISEWTSKVEYLTVNAIEPPKPPIPITRKVSPDTENAPDNEQDIVDLNKPRQQVDPEQACIIYKNMCPSNGKTK